MASTPEEVNFLIRSPNNRSVKKIRFGVASALNLLGVELREYALGLAPESACDGDRNRPGAQNPRRNRGAACAPGSEKLRKLKAACAAKLHGFWPFATIPSRGMILLNCPSAQAGER